MNRLINKFFSGTKQKIEEQWKLLRKYQPDGPLVNSEFYPGWFTHWQEPPGKVDPAPVAESLRFYFQTFYTIKTFYTYISYNFLF